MGEKQNQPFQLSFNASLKVDFQGSRVTSDGGLILIRKLDKRLVLEKLIEEHLSDSRQGLNKLFTLADLGAAGAERVALRLRVQNLGPRGGGLEQGLRNRLHSSKQCSSDGQKRAVGTA